MVSPFLSPGAAGSDAAVPRLSFSAALTRGMAGSGTIVFDKVLVNDDSAYNPKTGGSRPVAAVTVAAVTSTGTSSPSPW